MMDDALSTMMLLVGDEAGAMRFGPEVQKS